jgi:hypothetical protein
MKRLCSTHAFDPSAVRAEAARRRVPLYRLAVEVGTDPATLSRVLNGRTCPSEKLRAQLAKRLGLDINQ